MKKVIFFSYKHIFFLRIKSNDFNEQLNEQNESIVFQKSEKLSADKYERIVRRTNKKLSLIRKTVHEKCNRHKRISPKCLYCTNHTI